MTAKERYELVCLFNAMIRGNYETSERFYYQKIAEYGMGPYANRMEVQKHDYPLPR